MSFFRLSSSRLAHRLLCAVLAWLMLVAPLASLAGDIHEVDHAARGDLHFVVADGHADAAHSPADDADGDPLHALAHASHCCGQAVALLPSSPMLILAASPSSALAAIRPIGDRRSPCLPFRPPILA